MVPGLLQDGQHKQKGPERVRAFRSIRFLMSVKCCCYLTRAYARTPEGPRGALQQMQRHAQVDIRITRSDYPAGGPMRKGPYLVSEKRWPVAHWHDPPGGMSATVSSMASPDAVPLTAVVAEHVSPTSVVWVMVSVPVVTVLAVIVSSPDGPLSAVQVPVAADWF
jgi:hypothetical protein